MGISITPCVTLVGSGQFGFMLTHRLDCNVWLLDCGSEYALIDSGAGLEPERIVRQIEAAGMPMERIRHLILTHYHGDHAAGAAFWHEAYGMTLYGAAEGAEWLEAGDEKRVSLDGAKRAGAYPADSTFKACPVHVKVGEGDRITIGDVTLDVYETPGHSRGHISLLFEEDGARTLFSGDCLFAGGRIAIQNIWDCSIPEYAATVKKVDGFAIDRLFAGHGAPVLNEAWRAVRTANETFERLDIPPNL